jgi:chaperonin GroES
VQLIGKTTKFVSVGGRHSGTEVKIDGQELLIMKESDIMGIIDEPVSKKKAA